MQSANRIRGPRGCAWTRALILELVNQLVGDFGATDHIPVHRQLNTPPDKTLGGKSRRWVIERTHFWMKRLRLNLIRREK